MCVGPTKLSVGACRSGRPVKRRAFGSTRRARPIPKSLSQDRFGEKEKDGHYLSESSTVAVTTPWTPTRTGIWESAALSAVSCFMNSP